MATCNNLIWDEDADTQIVCGTPMLFGGRFCPVCEYDKEEDSRIQSMYEISERIRSGVPVKKAIKDAYEQYPEWRESRPIERLKEGFQLGKLKKTSLHKMTGNLLGATKSGDLIEWKDKKILETEDAKLRRLLKNRKGYLERKRPVSKLELEDDEEEEIIGLQDTPSASLPKKTLQFKYNLWSLTPTSCEPYLSGNRQVGSDDLDVAIALKDKASRLGYQTIIIPNPVRDRAFVIWEILPKFVIPYVYNHKGSLIHLGHSTSEMANKMVRTVLRDETELFASEDQIIKRELIVAPANQRFVEGFDTDRYLPNWNPNWSWTD